jgi:hypothetical protein
MHGKSTGASTATTASPSTVRCATDCHGGFPVAIISRWDRTSPLCPRQLHFCSTTSIKSPLSFVGICLAWLSNHIRPYNHTLHQSQPLSLDSTCRQCRDNPYPPPSALPCPHPSSCHTWLRETTGLLIRLHILTGLRCPSAVSRVYFGRKCQDDAAIQFLVGPAQ